MPGLFGKQSPRVADMFANMSGGQRFGQAVGNARLADEQRQAQAQAMTRQQGMDDLTRRFKEAQIADLGRGSGASTNAIRNAQYLYPNDPAKQQDYMQQLAQGATPSSIKEMNYLNNPNTTKEMKDLYWKNKRAGVYKETGRGQEYFGPATPGEGTILEGSTQAELIAAEVAKASDIKTAEAEAGRVAKLKADAPKAYSNMMGALDKVGMVNKKVRDLKADPNLANVTGWEAKFPTVLPESITTEKLIAELQSGATIQSLIDAKNSGATFGALSDTEIMILRDEIAALDPLMDDDAYQDQLDKVIAYMDNIDKNVRRAYQTQYGEFVTGSMAMPPEKQEQGTQQGAYPDAPPAGTIEGDRQYNGGDPGLESSWPLVRQ